MAGIAGAFCMRYLAAPFALDETMSSEMGVPSQPTTEEELSVSAHPEEESQAARTGRLTARPVLVEKTSWRGLLRLGLSMKRDGLIYVPPGYKAGHPTPLVLSLHGAGGNARQGLRLLQSQADRVGFIVLATDSRQRTWDVLQGGYGPDVEFINRALARTFSLYAVDPARIAVAGFSDGVSYALSLGITNGDLFKNVMGFSPGFVAPSARYGLPEIFISHGNQDKVLPIEKCSRRILPQLQQAGYQIHYREFNGPHRLPEEVQREAIDWWFSAGWDIEGNAARS